jgi:hypothetical protein
MNHTVTEDELSNYIEGQRTAWHQFASSAGVGHEVKRMEFCFGQVAPVYRVTVGSRAVYIGVLKETAVREYNALA